MSLVNRPAPLKRRILAERQADPEMPISVIARRAGASLSYTSAVLQPPRPFGGLRLNYTFRRETPLQRKMQLREYQREYHRKRRAAKREAGA